MVKFDFVTVFLMRCESNGADYRLDMIPWPKVVCQVAGFCCLETRMVVKEGTIFHGM